MNDYLLSVLLGIIEGLTEFLPVSSTAHLRIAEWLFRIDLASGYWKMFSIVIQLGAILALTAYFWRRILKFLHTFPHGESGERSMLNHPLSLIADRVPVHRGPGVFAHQIDREKPGEPLCHGARAPHWRRGHVGGRFGFR